MPQSEFSIGPVPGEEIAAQVGTPNFDEQSSWECTVYRRMLGRLFPVADGVDVRLAIVSSPHEFGSYREIHIKYDDNDPAAIELAFLIDREAPFRWDDIAMYELSWFERKAALFYSLSKGTITLADIPAAYRTGSIPVLSADMTLSELFRCFPL